LKAKRFRDEVFDKLFFHEFLSRTDEVWLAIWFEQQLMKKQKKNEELKRIKNAEDAKKVWESARKKEKTTKTKSAICVTKKTLLSEINIMMLIDSWSIWSMSLIYVSMKKQASKQKNLSVSQTILDRAKQSVSYLRIIIRWCQVITWQYVIQCLLYEKIYTHRVIEKDEFSSWIDVDHRDAQNEASHSC
jgi:hypothetical protein